MGPEHQDIREDARESMKDLNVEIALENGAKVHEVQEGDTLWDIVKTEYGFTDDTEVANSIIKISKVNMMNDTIKKDSLSVIDGKVVNSPDGIPGDLIFAGEKIIIEIEAKGVSPEIKQAELEDTDNELPNIDNMLDIGEQLTTENIKKLNIIAPYSNDYMGVETPYGLVKISKPGSTFDVMVKQLKSSPEENTFFNFKVSENGKVEISHLGNPDSILPNGEPVPHPCPAFSVEDILNNIPLSIFAGEPKDERINGYNAEGNADYYTNIEDGGTGGADGGVLGNSLENSTSIPSGPISVGDLGELKTIKSTSKKRKFSDRLRSFFGKNTK